MSTSEEIYIIVGMFGLLLLFTFIWMVGPYVSCCCTCSCKPKDGDLVLLEETGEVGASYSSFDCGCCYFVYTRTFTERNLVWLNRCFKSNRSVSTNDRCVICLESFERNITVLSCKHGFHDKCIRKWLFEKESGSCPCPLCHRNIPSQKIHLGVLSNRAHYPITVSRVYHGYPRVTQL